MALTKISSTVSAVTITDLGGIGTSNTATLTNKRLIPRTTTTTGAGGGTVTIDGDATDTFTVTALGAAITFAIPSGTPQDGQRLMIRIKDNGTARALNWTISAGGFRALGFTLPSTTVISKVLYIGCIYNSQDGYWDVLSYSQL